MKINKIFHTLYFMVMFLPLFIIPIFAININQKTVEPISIEVQDTLSIDFNQLIQPQFSSGTRTINGIDFVCNDEGNLQISGDATGDVVYTIYNYSTSFNVVQNNKYYVRIARNYTRINGIQLGIFLGSWQGFYENTILTANGGNSTTNQLWIRVNTTITDYLNLQPQIFNLTQMYGAGNEPTIQEFESIFNDNYYNYTLSQKELINGVVLTYDNTDIGSQFLYSIYKPVNDYFNFKQYFGMNAIYDWFQLNFFNGTAPLSFFIFFNLMIYWLIISMLWLLFDVLIYVPLMIHRWLDKASIS